MSPIDPTRSTVVAWYASLPDALARLVHRIHAVGAGVLVPRDVDQIHATVIGLERAAAPFDPGPLAAHLQTALRPPLTVRFGGFAPDDRRLLSRGAPLHDRTFSVRDGRAVLMGWPVVDDVPSTVLADVRDACAALGVTHRYGRDPDVHLVVADVPDAAPDADALAADLRAELARARVDVPLRAADLCLVTYTDPALPRASSTWRPLVRTSEPRRGRRPPPHRTSEPQRGRATPHHADDDDERPARENPDGPFACPAPERGAGI